jgi:hypothetical protein
MASDPYKSGRSLFQEFTSCRQIFGTANNMLNHIRALGDTSVVHEYMIHSPLFQNSNTTTKFWQVQATIILELCLIHLLSIIVAAVHPEHEGRSVKTFSTNLKLKGWILSSTDVHYPDLGNTIAGGCCIITAIHFLVHLLSNPCNSNGHHWSHHTLLVNSYGSHSTGKSMQSHWLEMTKTLPSRTQA